MSKEKYKIEISTGCTAFFTAVNGKNINDLTKEEYNEFLDYLLSTIKTHILNNNTSIESVIETMQYDKYEHSNTCCEQCGDTVSSTTWNI